MRPARAAVGPLVLAAMVLALPIVPLGGPGAAHGSAPDVGRPLYVNVTGPAGLGGFLHAGYLGIPEEDTPTFTEIMAAGGCWLDADQDGWLDLFLVNSVFQTHPERNLPVAPHSHLYRNDGDGTFTDVSRASGADIVGVNMGCAAADYDNDGDPDLFVAGWGHSTLLRNQGDGTFANVTAQAGVADQMCGDHFCWAASASWLDADRDGCLDLYVDHFGELTWDDPRPHGPNDHPPQRNRFYRNNCDGTFADATDAAGLGNDVRHSWSSVASDMDRDGWPDLYVSNDGGDNDYYLNDRDGTFTRVNNNANNGGRNGMGTCIGDLDHDDAWDIVTTNYVGQHNGIYRAEGGDYVDIGDQDPFTDAHPYSGWGCKWFDLNNDGHSDLMIVNSLPEPSQDEAAEEPILAYENLGGLAFQVVRDDLGPAIARDYVGRGGPWGDYDNDGAVDAVITEAGEAPVHLLRADKAGGNFLNVDLVGTAPGVTRDAVGARVKVSAPGLADQFQEKMLGSGFEGSDDPRLHFGLRDAPSAGVVVTWPDGSQQGSTGVRANSFVRLVQGQPLTVLRELPLVGIDGPSGGRRLASLSFEASATPGQGAGIARYDWDFGDGATASGPSASHAFTDVGTFFVKATATDTLGRAKTWQHPVLITDRIIPSVEFDAPFFLPWEHARGNVTARFPDGAPVRAADVRMVVTYSSGNAAFDAAAASLPRFLRDALGYVRAYVNVTTDAQGKAHFEVPSSQQPLPLGPGVSNPGRYTVAVSGSARGSPLDAATASYEVFPQLPGG